MTAHPLLTCPLLYSKEILAMVQMVLINSLLQLKSVLPLLSVSLLGVYWIVTYEVVIIVVGFSAFCWLEWRRRGSIRNALDGDDGDDGYSKRRRLRRRTSPPDEPRSSRRDTSSPAEPRSPRRDNSPVEPRSPRRDTSPTSPQSPRRDDSPSPTPPPSTETLSEKTLSIRRTMPRPSIEGFFPPLVPLPSRARVRG